MKKLIEANSELVESLQTAIEMIIRIEKKLEESSDTKRFEKQN